MRKEKVHRKGNPESLRTHDKIFKPAVNQSSANRQQETTAGHWRDGKAGDSKRPQQGTGETGKLDFTRC